MKSEQIRALNDEDTSVTIQRFTSKTLISGDRKIKQGEDFCNIFKEENEKLLLIFDMAQMLKLPIVEKAEVWAQLRDLYDGSLRRVFGNRLRKSYDRLRVTLIAGSTPHIDTQILIHQDLGTRELIYRTEKIKEYKKIINMVLKNEVAEEEMRRELHNITQKFLKYKTPKNILLTNQQIRKISNYVRYLSHMRAIADTDSFSGEVRGDVEIEMPTRIIKQLKRIFMALKSLEKNYPDKRAFSILRKIVVSSSNRNRAKIYHYVRNNLKMYEKRTSTSQISYAVELGKKTVFRELSILSNLNLICHEIREADYGKTFDFWYYDKEKCVGIPNLPLPVSKYSKRIDKDR
jgi:hypothetical protein